MAGETYIKYEYIVGKSGKAYPFVGYLVNEFVGVLYSVPISVPLDECDVSKELLEVLESSDDFCTVAMCLGEKLAIAQCQQS